MFLKREWMRKRQQAVFTWLRVYHHYSMNQRWQFNGADKHTSCCSREGGIAWNSHAVILEDFGELASVWIGDRNPCYSKCLGLLLVPVLSKRHEPPSPGGKGTLKDWGPQACDLFYTQSPSSPTLWLFRRHFTQWMNTMTKSNPSSLGICTASQTPTLACSVKTASLLQTWVLKVFERNHSCCNRRVLRSLYPLDCHQD